MSKTYREEIYELRRLGRNISRPVPWEYYAGHMDHNIVEKFVRHDLPRLKAQAIEFNKKRGRVTKKLVEQYPLKASELSPCELKVFVQMRKAGQVGLTIDGVAVPRCKCRWCCTEGMTCTQYRWNRLLNRW